MEEFGALFLFELKTYSGLNIFLKRVLLNIWMPGS